MLRKDQFKSEQTQKEATRVVRRMEDLSLKGIKKHIVSLTQKNSF